MTEASWAKANRDSMSDDLDSISSRLTDLHKRPPKGIDIINRHYEMALSAIEIAKVRIKFAIIEDKETTK